MHWREQVNCGARFRATAIRSRVTLQGQADDRGYTVLYAGLYCNVGRRCELFHAQRVQRLRASVGEPPMISRSTAPCASRSEAVSGTRASLDVCLNLLPHSPDNRITVLVLYCTRYHRRGKSKAGCSSESGRDSSSAAAHSVVPVVPRAGHTVLVMFGFSSAAVYCMYWSIADSTQ